MAMTTITPASFTRLVSTALDALAMRTLETEFRTNTIACGLVVALFATRQAFTDALEIKAAVGGSVTGIAYRYSYIKL